MSDSRNISTVDQYVRAVDDHLLAVPWRRRAEIRQDLRQHLEEAGFDGGVEPREYADELLEAEHPTVPVRFGGFASAWPTPREWVESGLRGVAGYMTLVVAWSLLVNLGAYLGNGMTSSLGLGGTVSRSFAQVLPVPAAFGSERLGLLVVVVAWLAGQLGTGLILERRPQARRLLRWLAVASAVWLAVLGTIAIAVAYR